MYIVKEATMVVEVAATQQRLFVYSTHIHLISTRYLGLFINKREKKRKKFSLPSWSLYSSERRLQISTCNKLYSSLEGGKY